MERSHFEIEPHLTDSVALNGHGAKALAINGIQGTVRVNRIQGKVRVSKRNEAK
jgi:hypothetical protein